MRAASAVVAEAPAAEIDLSLLQQQIGFHVHIFDVAQYQKFYENFADRGFTPAVFSTLAVIRGNPGVRHGALADALLIQRPNLTALLNDLERQGYVSRRPSPSDKRSVALYLTQRGDQALERMLDAMATLDREMTSALSTAERRTLLGLLQKALSASR